MSIMREKIKSLAATSLTLFSVLSFFQFSLLVSFFCEVFSFLFSTLLSFCSPRFRSLFLFFFVPPHERRLCIYIYIWMLVRSCACDAVRGVRDVKVRECEGERREAGGMFGRLEMWD